MLFSSQSQTVERINQINTYCDSLDKLNDIQTVRKTGAGVTLEYKISNGALIKIIEHPAGYKFISATATYYFQNNKSVFVTADIEISNEDGDKLTLELHKIYLADNHILEQLTSEQTYGADSLYNNSTDPIKTSVDIRRNPKFKRRSVDLEFEKNLLLTIDNYIDARTRKNGDPVLDKLSSPFI